MGQGMGDMAAGTGNIAGGIAGYFASSAGTMPGINLTSESDNANAAYNTATGDATQTMNAATALNGQSAATLQQANGNNTNAMSALNGEANENMANYGSTFANLQNEQANQAANYTSEGNVKQLQGMATADQGQATQAALANQRASLASEGVDPASVHGSALTQQGAIQGAANAAGAASNAYQQAQVTGAGMMNNANQIGLNVGAQGAQQAASSAGIGNSSVANTNSTNSTAVNNLTAANTYLNTGVQANQSQANILGEQYNAGQQTYQDQQQQAASKASSIGQTVGGMGQVGAGAGEMASSAMMEGGPVTHHGALPYPIVPGTTDTKLAALTPGEFVIPKDVTQHLGHEKLHKLIDKTREEIGERHMQRHGALPPPKMASANFQR